MRPTDKSAVPSYLEKFLGREDQCPEADPVPAYGHEVLVLNRLDGTVSAGLCVSANDRQ